MGNLHGIDIASYQAGVDTKTIAGDFIIVKATQGTGYINPYWKNQIDGAIKSGKIVGLYHYASGQGAAAEVNFFLQTVKDYIGRAFLCLDWEHIPVGGPNSQFRNPAYAKQFMELVKQRTGVTMFIYGSKDSCFNAMDWSQVKAAGFRLWGAQYASYAAVNGYNSKPWQSTRPWGAYGQELSIFQYTSNLRLSGWAGGLDGNLAYMTEEALVAMASGKATGPVVVLPAEDEALDRASILELVAATMDNKYGTRETRKKKLGSRYKEVQDVINYVDSTPASQLATDVISGKFGNDSLRKKVLGKRYAEVQRIVDTKLAAMKPVDVLAQEVKEGKWGNDPERTMKLRAAGYDSAAVQKAVNRLMAA